MKANNIDIYSIKLAQSQMPKLTIDLTRNIVRYGPRNDFPAYLLFLQKNHPIHGGIVKGKARYITGTKITAKEQTPQSELFLSRANRNETVYDITKKTDVDEVTSGGCFIKVVSNLVGTPLEYYHLPWAMCRISPCQNYVSYSEDWSNIFLYPITCFPVWNEGKVGTSVFVYKNYSSQETKLKSTYAEPEYISVTLDIDTDVRIGTFGNSIVKNNFSAGNIITIKNGETDKVKQKSIAESLKFNHEGEDEAGKTVVVFGNKDTPTTEVTTVNTNDQDKLYLEMGKRNQQNVLTAHNVPGILFKIKTEGQLGGRTELVEAHELFINEYAKVKQEAKLNIWQKFFKLRFGVPVEFEIEQVEAIGLELPLDNQNVITAIGPEAFKDYVFKKFGLEKPVVLDATGQPIQEQSVSVNDNMKGLSAAENADVLRIVRDFQKGRSGMTEPMAISRISSYGVTEQEARKWLGLPEANTMLSKENKAGKFFSLFAKYSHDVQPDEVLNESQVNFNSARAAILFEDAVSSEAQLNDSVLNQLKGNPQATDRDIAKALDVTEEVIATAILALITAGLISSLTDRQPTEKGLNKQTDNTDFEIYTEYVYDLRPGVNYSNRKNKINDKLLHSSHQFCKDMILTYGNKALTFEAINSMQNEFGENVWDFRGGFTTQKDGTVEPWCNHIFKAVTKRRLVKK